MALTRCTERVRGDRVGASTHGPKGVVQNCKAAASPVQGRQRLESDSFESVVRYGRSLRLRDG